jgi:periplasmic protein TonB
MTVLLRLDRPAIVAPPRLQVRQRHRIGPAALLSLGLHVALIGVAVLWMRRSTPVVPAPGGTPATVQLIMSPPGGEPHPAAAPQPQTPPAPKVPQQAATAAKTPPAAPVTAEAAPPPPPSSAAPPQPPSPPAPPSANDKLTFDFAQAESDTNALVTGDLVVPASPDVKFHNRKPSYPVSAAWRGEQGAVILMIHVAPDGLVTSVDVVRSSGFAALDSAARDAVLTWHFLPSVKDGQPVPDDVPIRFVFALK